MKSIVALSLCLAISTPITAQDLSELGVGSDGEIDFATLLSQISFEGPVSCPSDDTIQGYSNITQFVIDFALTQLFNPVPETYTICPNAVYNMTEELSLNAGHLPLVVPFDDITINCGVDGSVENNCVLNGGYVHAVLGGANTVLNGFTFQNSMGVSVVAAGPSPNTATLNNCIFKNNSGYGIFYSQKFFDSIASAVADIDSLMALLPSTPSLAELPDSLGQGMTTTFDNCQFTDNPTQISLMFSNQSSLVINNGYFARNSAVEADIILDTQSDATIENSCFIDEGKRNFGLIFVSSDSSLTNDGTHSSNVTGKYCNDIYKEPSTGVDCLLSPESCESKTCMDFTATSCSLSPSPPPTPSPVDEPAAQPSAGGTPAASSAAYVNIAALANVFITSSILIVGLCI